jgi:hypothetical protein
MQQKEGGPVGSGAHTHCKRRLSFEDKYLTIQHVSTTHRRGGGVA